MGNIWCNRDNISGYNNRYVTVTVYKENFTEEELNQFEQLVNDEEKEKKRIFGSLEGVMNAECFSEKDHDVLCFDIHKGDFEAAQRLSTIYPDAVVFVNDDWDSHDFEVFKNGQHYDDYTVAWEGDEPEPYVEGEDEYYDCDVVVSISLPFTSEPVKDFSGGGMCTKEEFYAYKTQIENSQRKDVKQETHENLKDSPETQTFYVPFSYEMYGRLEIEAPAGTSIEKLQRMAEEKLSSMSLQDMAACTEYLADSEEIDYDGIVLDEKGNSFGIEDAEIDGR